MKSIYKKNLFRHNKTIVAFFVSLMLCSSASAFELYSDEDSKATIQSNEYEDSHSFGLYHDDLQKAPPGGGDPIGGVPVGDGVFALMVLTVSYFFFKNRNNLIKSDKK